MASIVGAPISGLVLDRAHWLGASSWRCLLILVRLPAISSTRLTGFVFMLLASGACLMAQAFGQQGQVVRVVLEDGSPPPKGVTMFVCGQ